MELTRKKRRLTLSIRETPSPGCKGRTSNIPLVKQKPTCSSATEQAVELEQQNQEQEIPVPVHDVGIEIIQQETNTSGWKDVGDDFLNAYLEDTYQYASCINCELPLGEEMHIKCNDCGSESYFCSKTCLSAVHKWNLNPLHKPMELHFSGASSEIYRYRECYIDIQFRRPNHECSTQHPRYGIRAYDHLGRCHLISAITCKCEKECVTMLRYGFWASSIEKPSVVFHTELLDTIEFLTVEGKMSLLSICQALRCRNNLTSSQCSTLYKQLCGEPISHYRFFKCRMRQLTTVSDNGRISSCRACLNDGNVFVSLDANFGLVRKKGATSAHRTTPNHGTTMFMETPEDTTAVSSSISESCSNFQAITALRTKSTLSKLDVNGVFGCACRHGVPVRFLDFSHRGERFYLAVAIINSLLDQIKGTNVKLHVIYDIGCVLDAHLKAKGERFKDISVAVPVFHAYGHSGSCQVGYSTRWKDGYGLTDGEDMERLWSFLRRFSFSTKEMTAAHRIDLLTEALIHYSSKKNDEMDLALLSKMEKANSLITTTKEELAVYLEGSLLTTAEANHMAVEYAKNMSVQKSKENVLTDTETYVDLLSKQDALRKGLVPQSDSERQRTVQEQIDRLEADIKKKEKNLKIVQRWTAADRNFKKLQLDIKKKQRNALLLSMRHQALQYQFLLSLKGKYGERNQKIAERLQKQIQKTAKNIRASIEKFSKGKHGDLTFTTASKPDDPVYKGLTTGSKTVKIGNHEFDPSTQHQISLLVNTLKRATEESTILQKEMLSVLQCLSEEHLQLDQKLQECQNMKQVIMTICSQSRLRHTYFRARESFVQWVKLPSVPGHLQLAEDTFIDLESDIAFREAVADEESCAESEEDEDEDDNDNAFGF